MTTPDVKALADELEGCITRSGGIDLRDPDLLRKAAAALRAAPEASGAEPVAKDRPHRLMTDEEYAALQIVGPHLVCKDYDGEPGSVALWYTTPSASPPPADVRGAEVAAWNQLRELWSAISGHGPRCRDCADSDGTCCNDEDKRPCDPHARALHDLAKLKAAALATPPVADAGIAAPPTQHMTTDGIDAAFASYRKTLTIMDPKADHQSFAQGYVAGWNAKEAALPAASADAVRKKATKIISKTSNEALYNGAGKVINPEIFDEAAAKILALTAPVAVADASPSAMRERAALKRIRDFPHERSASEQAMSQIAREALSPDAGVVPPADAPQT